MASIRAEGRDALRSNMAAPFAATVHADGKDMPWPTGANRLTIGHVTQAMLTLNLDGQELKRFFELPINQTYRVPEAPSIGAHREAVLFEALDWIDGRPDCADFPLAAIVRLYGGDTLTQRERDRIKATALNFRYWPDEPGNDAMCFGSENHSLLFHGCQMIAGNLFPDEVFPNSGRLGKDQAQIGKARCEKWLDRVEARGFSEFLSSTYMPFTHAHWPGDVCDAQQVDGHWAFGKKGTGCIGLWCSAPLTVCSDVLTDRELRARGQKVAWIACCGSGDLNAFMKACRERQPAFDAASLSLFLDGEVALNDKG